MQTQAIGTNGAASVMRTTTSSGASFTQAMTGVETPAASCTIDPAAGTTTASTQKSAGSTTAKTSGTARTFATCAETLTRYGPGTLATIMARIRARHA